MQKILRVSSKTGAVKLWNLPEENLVALDLRPIFVFFDDPEKADKVFGLLKDESIRIDKDGKTFGFEPRP